MLFLLIYVKNTLVVTSLAEVNMKKFSDSQIDLSLWHSKPSLWDSTKATYCNADDARRAALSLMSKELDIDIGIFIVGSQCIDSSKVVILLLWKLCGDGIWRREWYITC